LKKFFNIQFKIEECQDEVYDMSSDSDGENKEKEDEDEEQGEDE